MMVSDKPRTPRLLLLRHGPTEWSQNGRHTSVTDLPLLPWANKPLGAIPASQLKHLTHVFISPRLRAKQTFDALASADKIPSSAKIVENEQRVTEIHYGDYEGLVAAEINELVYKRTGKQVEKGKKAWDLWTEAAPNGESPESVQKRVDDIVEEVKRMHLSGEAGDVMIVSHGHISQAIVKRWVGCELSWKGVEMLTPGGIGILSYNHGRMDEPGIVVSQIWESADSEPKE